MAAPKLTIDLTDKNREILERIKAEKRSPYGTTINELIDIFCDVPDSVKKELLDFIKPKIRDLYRQMDAAGEFGFKEISEKTQSYMDIAKFLNDGKSFSINEIDSVTTMQKIPMYDGFLICPDNYLIANPEQAENMSYACVVECRNADKYGTPHIVIFSNFESVNQYDKIYEESIHRMCCRVYPEFEEILELQVKPIDDPDNPGMILNSDEWMKAPNIGLFDVYIEGDPKYGFGYEPAGGTRIIRTKTEDDD